MIFQKKARNDRSQLKVREITSPGIFVRPGNLFELAWFVRKFPKFPFTFGPIEGFDGYLETLGKEMGIPITIPVACFDIENPVITLEPNNRKRMSRYQLVVV